MTIGWPRLSCMPGTTLRAAMSTEPPGSSGTTMRIGFEGNVWACAQRHSATSAKAHNGCRMTRILLRSRYYRRFAKGRGVLPYTSVDGIRTHYLTQGIGPVLLMLAP